MCGTCCRILTNRIQNVSLCVDSYSFCYYCFTMEAELNSLDDRIQQLIRVAERLRTENGELRQQLAASLNEGKQLRDRMTAARLRLEGVLTRLPQDGEAS